jgi:hypothetical protein
LKTISNYTKFKKQTKEVFLKITEAIHPVKVTRKASSHAKVDEYVSDKNKNSEAQKKYIIEDYDI